MIENHGHAEAEAARRTDFQRKATGIPTMYRGVRMRSRTEARFAAFFDSLGWEWVYEPFDLDGYILDFLLQFREQLLVEVKPTPDSFDEARSKIDASGWDGEALIVSPVFDGSTIGSFGAVEPGPDGGQRVWGSARMFYCISCGHISVLPEHSDWECRVCGNGYGNEHVGEYDPRAAWAAAGNRVQWRPAT